MVPVVPSFLRPLLGEFERREYRLQAVESDGAVVAVGSAEQIPIAWRSLPSDTIADAVAWFPRELSAPAEILVSDALAGMTPRITSWCLLGTRALAPGSAFRTASDAGMGELLDALISAVAGDAFAHRRQVGTWTSDAAHALDAWRHDRYAEAPLETLRRVLAFVPLEAMHRAVQRVADGSRALACDDVAAAYVVSRVVDLPNRSLASGIAAAFRDPQGLLGEAVPRLVQEVRDLPFEGDSSSLRLGAAPRRWQLPWWGDRVSQLMPVLRYLHAAVAEKLRTDACIAHPAERASDATAKARAALPNHSVLRAACARFIRDVA